MDGVSITRAPWIRISKYGSRREHVHSSFEPAATQAFDEGQSVSCASPAHSSYNPRVRSPMDTQTIHRARLARRRLLKGTAGMAAAAAGLVPPNVRGFDYPDALCSSRRKIGFYQPDAEHPSVYMLPFHLYTHASSAQRSRSTSVRGRSSIRDRTAA